MDVALRQQVLHEVGDQAVQAVAAVVGAGADPGQVLEVLHARQEVLAPATEQQPDRVVAEGLPAPGKQEERGEADAAGNAHGVRHVFRERTPQRARDPHLVAGQQRREPTGAGEKQD